mmetsp:Transcript_9933/g.17897  ORF Transcript_9933/g.17897 Transcript_9933/m.17897 type:complete len:327 (+) Transcript_9933:63-1043(+)
MGLVTSAERLAAGAASRGGSQRVNLGGVGSGVGLRPNGPDQYASSGAAMNQLHSAGIQTGSGGNDANPVVVLDPSAAHHVGSAVGFDRNEESLGNIVPTVFTWSHGGNAVFVTGAWDHWQSKAPMHRTGNEYSVILSLQVGHFQYKFIVDGEWRHCGLQPTERDDHGNINNVVDIKPRLSEFDIPEPIAITNRPMSPFESYDFSMPAPEEYAIDPPQLPPHYHSVVLNQPGNPSRQQLNHHATAVVSSPASGVELSYMMSMGAERASSDPTRCDVPLHVSIKHLYTALRHHPDEEVNVLGMTRRYKTKFVTTVMYMSNSTQDDSLY